MLPRLRLLQIGDVHLPSSADAKPFLDDKDRTFPSRLAGRLGGNPLKTVVRRIYETLQEGSVDGVFIMGDLTDYGKIDGFRAACRYIASSLLVGEGRTFADIPVGIVPGNHDIDRKLASQPSMTAKFEPLATALAEVGLSNFPVKRPVRMELGAAGRSSTAFLLNSCWGCGEQSYIPQEFRLPIAAAIDGVVGGDAGAAAIRTYYDRQLDTPAISDDTATELVEGLRRLSGESLGILVAHHNLLPQRMTRLAPYTELVNGGALRGSLCEIGRPLLYLHGHIHEDPIDLISAPGGSPLISISAPLLKEGFNVIDIVYSPSGVPLAVHVKPIRFDRSGILVEQEVVAVSLSDRRRRLVDPTLTPLFLRLLERRRVYWPEVEAIGASLDGRPGGARLVEMLEQLNADQLITIDNADLQPNNWLVKAEM
jgi:hypothetical protein